MNPAELASAVDPLAGLRAYRLPDDVSWWPPAPGWWMLGALLVAAVVVLALWWRRRRRARAAYRAALDELAGLRAEYAREDDASAFTRGLSKLLRRYAIVAHPHREVASLTGEAWLRFLDAHGGGARFAAGDGRQLLDAPYRPVADVDATRLAGLVEAWIRHNCEVRR